MNSAEFSDATPSNYEQSSDEQSVSNKSLSLASQNERSSGSKTTDTRQHNDVSWGTVAEDFGRSFVQSAVINPLWNGFGQLVSAGHLPQFHIDNPENAERSEVDSWAQKIGGALGMALDFYALHKLKVLAFGQGATARELSSMSTIQRTVFHAKESAKLGAFYGAVLSPSDVNEDLIFGRLKNAGAEALTFSILGGGFAALSGLKPLAKIQQGTLANAVSDMGIAGIAGLTAGATGAIAHTALDGRPITAEAITESAIDFGVIGIGLAGLTHGVSALRPARSADPIGLSPRSSTFNPNEPLERTRMSKGTFREPSLPLDLGSQRNPRIVLTKRPSSSRRTQSLSESETPTGQKETVESALGKLANEFDQQPLSHSRLPSRLSGRFITENATTLDAIYVPKSNVQTAVELGDRVMRIKRHINTHGEPAREYLAKVINESNVTLVGEMHTYKGPNPHRLLFNDLIRDMPRDTTLVVEFPATLRPIFERFRRSSDGQLSVPVFDLMSSQESLSLLRAMKREQPEYVAMWEAARERGFDIVPIDVGRGKEFETFSESRESQLAENLLKLSEERGSKPIVAYVGNLHAARSTTGSLPYMAQRVLESPDFASGKKKMSSVFGQISETEVSVWPLSFLARKVNAPVGVPIALERGASPLDGVPIAINANKDLKVDLSSYDHLLLYPQADAKVLSDYHNSVTDAYGNNILPDFAKAASI